MCLEEATATAKVLSKTLVPHVQMQTRKPEELAGGGVIRDGVRDTEEQGGLSVTTDTSIHREFLLPCCSLHFVNFLAKMSYELY